MDTIIRKHRAGLLREPLKRGPKPRRRWQRKGYGDPRSKSMTSSSVLATGSKSQVMPNDLPHWKTCYHYSRLWAKLDHWERIHHAIRDMARLAVGKKKPRPLRLSIVKAFGQLASPEFVVMMRVRRLQEESDTFW